MIAPVSKKHIRNLLLTFDYELFLGEWSGNVEECVIKPSAEIIKLLDKYSLKGIFFVDATYLYYLNETAKKHENARKDFLMIENQLQELLKKGHKLYMHIHPHWKDAVYHPEKNQWSCSIDKNFAIVNLNEEERKFTFEKSFEILQKICSINSSHKIEGYRAGGLFIQPFEIFIPYFNKYGIKYDFSVLPGFSGQGNHCGYDFTDINIKEIYNFETLPTKPEKNGCFIEFPISIIQAGIRTKILNSLWYRLFRKNTEAEIWGNGIPTKNKLNTKKKSKKTEIRESATIEMMNPVKVNAYADYLKQNSFMQFITHPKFLSPMHLKAFEKFIQIIQKKYLIFTDIHEIMASSKIQNNP